MIKVLSEITSSLNKDSLSFLLQQVSRSTSLPVHWAMTENYPRHAEHSRTG